MRTKKLNRGSSSNLEVNKKVRILKRKKKKGNNMLNNLFDNLIKSPITSLIGAITCGFTLFNSEASQTISTASPIADSIVTIAKNVQTGWGIGEWVQFLGSLALMFYAKDKGGK